MTVIANQDAEIGKEYKFKDEKYKIADRIYMNQHTSPSSFVTDMSRLFYGGCINGMILSSWDVSNVTDMSEIIARMFFMHNH